MDKTYIIEPDKEYLTRDSIAFKGEYTYLIDKKVEMFKEVNRARSCFEQHLICDGTLRNVTIGRRVVGFSLGIRLNWYRSFAITLIRRIEIMVDGELIPRRDITFQVEGQPNCYRLDDIGEAQAAEYWFLNKIGQVTVDKLEGLSKGTHEVEVLLEMYVTYHNYPDTSYMKKVMIID